MSSNVVSIPFGDISEIEDDTSKHSKMQAVNEFIPVINDWFEEQGIDIYTENYKHQAAVIMAQLQSILIGN